MLRLSTIGLSCYAAPTYLARRGKPKGWSDAQHDWVINQVKVIALRDFLVEATRARVMP